MAKRGEGTPSIKRTNAGRRQLSRKEREDRMNRWVVIATSALIIAVVGLLFAGIIYELAVKPNQAVATVGDVSITSTQFEQRVKYERYQVTSNYLNYCSDETLAQYFQQYCEQWQQQLEFPTSLGGAVLDAMIEEEIIRQEAAARGITVPEEEISDEISALFGYDPNAEPPTETPEPSATPTLRYTPTPTNTPAPTATQTPADDETDEPAEEAAPTLDVTLAPTSTPTIAPTLTDGEKEEQADKNYSQQLAVVQALAGMSEAQYRAIFEAQALRDKLYDEITNAIPAIADQVRVRQIRVGTEAEAIEILEALRDGESFAELAKGATAALAGSEPSWYLGGDAGWLPRDQLTSSVADAAFEAEVGEILGPIFEVDMEAMAQTGTVAEYYYVVQVLGHEVRPVDEAVLQQQRSTHFDTWLSGKQSQAESYSDVWVDRIPDGPTQEEIVAEMQKHIPTATSEAEEES
jgi:parvulin-like peptidyl-prolyl isomerase